MIEHIFYLARNAEKLLRIGGAEFKFSPLFFRMALVILKNPEITADTLSKLLVADKALITRTVGELEERGLIVRKKNPNDKRSFLILPSESLLEIKDRLYRIERETAKALREIMEKENISF